jgi:hypothetical protein
MELVSHKKLYLPACLILGVVLILRVFISISTYQMFHRQRHDAQDTVRRQGLALLQALESGVHSGLLIHCANPQAIRHYIMELVQIQDVANLFILRKKSIAPIRALTPAISGRHADQFSFS